MKIEINRDSVCMGDDCMSHKFERDFDNNLKLSELLKLLSDYVPTMKNVIWAVVSLNTNDKVIGYFIMDENGETSIEIDHDVILEKLFIKDLDDISVFCRYFHNSSFTRVDRTTGEKVEKYPDCDNLYDKVKKVYEKNETK